jgi:hypothetical protein
MVQCVLITRYMVFIIYRMYGAKHYETHFDTYDFIIPTNTFFIPESHTPQLANIIFQVQLISNLEEGRTNDGLLKGGSGTRQSLLVD